ncbi:phage tail protein [Vibrio vulnificus]
MSDTVALVPVITTKGLAAVFNATNDGFAAKVTHIALGDHGRTPSKNEQGLVNERMRIPIADGQRIDDFQIHLTALASGGTGFWVKEISFILEDGTTLAIWSDEEPLAYLSVKVPLLLAFDLVLSALPAQSVTVIGTGANLSLAVWWEPYISSVTSAISSGAYAIKNALWNMQLSEKIRTMEKFR